MDFDLRRSQLHQQNSLIKEKMSELYQKPPQQQETIDQEIIHYKQRQQVLTDQFNKVMKKIQREERLDQLFEQKKAKTVALRKNKQPVYDPKPIEIPIIEIKKKTSQPKKQKTLNPKPKLEFVDAAPLPQSDEEELPVPQRNPNIDYSQLDELMKRNLLENNILKAQQQSVDERAKRIVFIQKEEKKTDPRFLRMDRQLIQMNQLYKAGKLQKQMI